MHISMYVCLCVDRHEQMFVMYVYKLIAISVFVPIMHESPCMFVYMYVARYTNIYICVCMHKTSLQSTV